MRRVLVLNNYPLDRVWDEVRLGEAPDHHLFGVNYFHERGYEPVIIPIRRRRWDRRPRWRSPFELGDIRQQCEALRRRGRGDIVYAPCATQTHALHYLRAAGLLRTPIVCVMHHPFLASRADVIRRPQRRLFVRGADRLASLSRSVAVSLREFGARAARTQVLRWGPDADYYPVRPTAGSGVVAAGRTARDFATLALASRSVASPVVLIGLESGLEGEPFRPHDRLRMIRQPNQPPQPGRPVGWMKYPELLEYLEGARAVAIPLLRQQHLCGLTSLMDALGLGKPVVMTRNPQIDLDIEAHGIGLWVEPGDVDGWINAMNWFEAHPVEAVQMGLRARALVDAGLNSRSFAHAVMDLFDQVTA